jgi:hypothetical protein
MGNYNLDSHMQNLPCGDTHMHTGIPGTPRMDTCEDPKNSYGDSPYAYGSCYYMGINTYTSYMILLTAGMLGLPCRPCSGPQQLKFGDYWLVVTILGLLECHNCISGTTPSFITRIFALSLSGDCLGEPSLCWQQPRICPLSPWACQWRPHLMAPQLPMVPCCALLVMFGSAMVGFLLWGNKWMSTKE